jgi:hypothetical protein
MNSKPIGSNRQTSVAPPGYPGGDTGVPFQRPPRYMDRGAQTWGSTALFTGSAYAATAAYVPRGPGEEPDASHDRPMTGFRSRIPRNDV